MFQNLTEILTLIAAAFVQRLLYRSGLPKDFTPARILVVKLDHLGDVLLATPVFANLRQAYPDAEIDALVGGWSRVVLADHADVDNVITYNAPVFSRTGAPTSLADTVRLYRQLRARRYDLMIDLRSDWRIVCFALLRVTPKRLSRAALQVASKFGRARFSGTHETTRNLDLLARIGVPTPVRTASFTLTAADKKWASDLLATLLPDTERPVVVIHPGSPIALKRWAPARYAELADRLIAEKRTHVLFVGVEAERQIVADVQARMRGEAIPLVGETDFRELASILHVSDMFIGNDSGPMHLAAAVGTPTIGLYGPGDPTRFAPAGEKCRTLRGRTDCPCVGQGAETCRLGATGCVSEIRVVDVIRSVESMLCLTELTPKRRTFGTDDELT